MSAPIDIDLIELRCQLRGWTYERFDNPSQIHIECKYGGWLQIQPGKRVRREQPWADTTAHKRIEALLMAPRWTLERLMSSPPEGWSCIDLQLVWGELVAETARHEIVAGVKLWDGKFGLDVSVYGDAGSNELVRFAERLKVVAELALVVAEIEPC